MIIKKKSNTIFKISELYNKYLKRKKKKDLILIIGSGKFIWEYYLKKKISKSCKIYSIDKENFEKKNEKKNFIKIDIFSSEFFNRISKIIINKVDIIICDVCCKTTGIKEKDSLFFLKLFKILKKTILNFLSFGGILVFKYLNKCNIDKNFTKLKEKFNFVKFVKLNSSKTHSSEFYAIFSHLKCI
ncbi:SAM-dependent methyltransferase [Candidatus Vidania fulgoroideorum]